LVRIAEEIPKSWVASIHVDDPAVEDEVALAVVLIGCGRHRRRGRRLRRDGIDDHELLWFATQELADLLG